MNNSIAIQNFNQNIASCEEMITLYESVENILSLEEKAKDILRATIVLSISALDTYLHDFFRTEIVDAYFGISNYEVNLDKVKINMDLLKTVSLAETDGEKRNILTQGVRTMLKTDSFQSSKSIEFVLSTLGIKKVWAKLEEKGVNNLQANEIREELSSIVDRRNKIAHESDWDFVNNRKLQIRKDDTIQVIRFIKALINAIDTLE